MTCNQFLFDLPLPLNQNLGPPRVLKLAAGCPGPDVQRITNLNAGRLRCQSVLAVPAMEPAGTLPYIHIKHSMGLLGSRY